MSRCQKSLSSLRWRVEQLWKRSSRALYAHARDSNQRVASFKTYIVVVPQHHSQRGYHLPSYLRVLWWCLSIYGQFTVAERIGPIVCLLADALHTREPRRVIQSTYVVLNMLVGDWIIFFNNCTISLYIVPPRVRGRNMFLWWQSVLLRWRRVTSFSIVNIGL